MHAFDFCMHIRAVRYQVFAFYPASLTSTYFLQTHGLGSAPVAEDVPDYPDADFHTVSSGVAASVHLALRPHFRTGLLRRSSLRSAAVGVNVLLHDVCLTLEPHLDNL